MSDTVTLPISSTDTGGTQTRTRLTDPALLTRLRAAWVVFTLATFASYLVAVTGLAGAFQQAAAEAGLAGGAATGYMAGNLAFYVIVGGSSYIVGTLLFVLRSDDWLAILTSAMLIGMGGHLVTGAGQSVQISAPWLIYPASVIEMIAVLLFLLWSLSFPSGELWPVRPRWWAALALAPVVYAVTFIVNLSASQTGDRFNTDIPVPPALVTLAFMLVVITFSSGVLFQLARYRRKASQPERRQMKWVVVGFASVILAALMWVASLFLENALGGAANAVLLPLGTVMFLALPVSLVVAVTRYRLWDIDFILNRATIYGLLTVTLGMTMALGFFGVKAALDATLGPGQNGIALAVAAALAVALFNPARNALRSFVDKKLYGINIEYSRKASTPQIGVSGGESLGRFEGLTPIGEGGMAEVFKATDSTTGVPVAVKVLAKKLASDPDFTKRFQREAQVISQVAHPHIVGMVALGEQDGTYYMAMEYIDGPDLRQHLHEYDRMGYEETCVVIDQVASALDHVHAKGIIHRDIKPSNVMLDRVAPTQPRAVLMDFGIARITGSVTQITATGMLGTFDYMAPEQINDSKEVDARADVYALGALAYQMLTGEKPFTATNPAAVLIAHLNQPCPDVRDLVPSVPAAAAKAIQRAMAKDPADRFASAGAFAAALHADD